jgi:hypothetical protein
LVAKHNTKPVPVVAVLSTFPFLIFLDLLKKNLPSKNFSFLFHKLLADSSFLKEKIAQSFRCAGPTKSRDVYFAAYEILHLVLLVCSTCTGMVGLSRWFVSFISRASSTYNVLLQFVEKFCNKKKIVFRSLLSQPLRPNAFSPRRTGLPNHKPRSQCLSHITNLDPQRDMYTCNYANFFPPRLGDKARGT